MRKSPPRWTRLAALLLLVTTLSLGLMPSSALRANEPAPPAGPDGATGASAAGLSPLAQRRTDLNAFGMTVIHFTPTDVSKARAVGSNSVLVGLFWSTIEPVRTNPPTYNWTVADTNISRALANNLEPVMLITGNPAWAFLGGPDDSRKILNDTGRAALAQLTAAAIQRYETMYPGKIRIWSFYNEPDCNGATYLPLRLPIALDVPSSCYGNYGGEYTKMLQQVTPAVKAANPNALVAIGGVAYDAWAADGAHAENFVPDLLASGGANHFDLMNFHYYVDYADKWAPYGPDVVGKTNALRGLMAGHGVDKPIILTELGMRSDREGLDAQADYVLKGQARAFGAGNSLVLWYEMVDELTPNSAAFGLIRSDGSRKPSYTAYRVLSEKIRDIATSGQPETGFPGVEAYRFQGNGRLVLIAWTTDGSTRTIEVAGSQVTRTQRTGCSTLIRDTDDGNVNGQVAVPIGASPAILEISGSGGTIGGNSGPTYLPTILKAGTPATGGATLAQVGAANSPSKVFLPVVLSTPSC